MLQPMEPSVMALITLGSGLGVVLARLALKAHHLEVRRPPGRCAACGRLLENGHSCSCGGPE